MSYPHRPILLPDAGTFAEVLEYVREWDHYDMTHTAGERRRPGLVPAPRLIGENEIGPFATLELEQLASLELEQPARRSFAVRATDEVLEVLAPRIVTPDDHLSFRLIGHASSGRVAVFCQHGYISGSHWLANVDPASLPAYPFAARDAAVWELCEQIKRATGWVPYRVDHGAGEASYGYSAIDRRDAGGRFERLARPVLIARVHADGTVDTLAELPR